MYVDKSAIKFKVIHAKAFAPCDRDPLHVRMVDRVCQLFETQVRTCMSLKKRALWQVLWNCYRAFYILNIITWNKLFINCPVVHQGLPVV